MARSKPRRTNARYNRSKKADELSRIEDFLGEEFESLSEARKALKAETGVAPNKASYTVQELSTRKHRTVKTFIPDLESHRQEIDTLKKPSDFWAAEIYGHGTYNLYGSIEQLARKLATYRGLAEEHPKKALSNIKIIRVSGVNAIADYYKSKKIEVEKSWRKTKDRHKLDRVRQRKQAKQIKGLKKQIATLKAKLRK